MDFFGDELGSILGRFVNDFWDDLVMVLNFELKLFLRFPLSVSLFMSVCARLVVLNFELELFLRFPLSVSLFCSGGSSKIL